MNHKALMKNWEARKLHGLNVDALYRYTVGKLEIYMYGMDPDDNDKFSCVVCEEGQCVEHDMDIRDFHIMQAVSGDAFQQDHEYRPRQIDTILTQNREKPYETN